jgi:hypothetical protein
LRDNSWQEFNNNISTFYVHKSQYYVGLLNLIFLWFIFFIKIHLLLTIKKKLNENINNSIKKTNKIFSEADALIFLIILP